MLSVTPTYASFFERLLDTGQHVGDVTFRKMSSLAVFGLVWEENTHRTFSEETEHVQRHC